jgi:hypothetical protein
LIERLHYRLKWLWAGTRFAATDDITSKAQEFGVAILALAALALIGTSGRAGLQQAD